MLELNTLLTKDQHMYEIYEIKQYLYKGEKKVTYFTYEVSPESGLIKSSNKLKIRNSDLHKFNVLNWIFR